MGDPKGFMKYAREGPKRKPVELRVLDWKEMYEPHRRGEAQDPRRALHGLRRAVLPGITGCPVVNMIPEWNDLVYRGRWKDALKALHTTNNFPEFTGRLCPAPCEGACVLGINEDPVSIRIIEWNIIDRGFNEGAGRADPARHQDGEDRRDCRVRTGGLGGCAATRACRPSASPSLRSPIASAACCVTASPISKWKSGSSTVGWSR